MYHNNSWTQCTNLSICTYVKSILFIQALLLSIVGVILMRLLLYLRSSVFQKVTITESRHQYNACHTVRTYVTIKQLYVFTN